MVRGKWGPLKTGNLVVALRSEKRPKRKANLERIREIQLPFAHMIYFSLLPVLGDKSASLSRETTASTSEEGRILRGEQQRRGQEGARFRHRAGTLSPVI